jgi:2-dehydro-3-deoxyphosphogluconate aldolase / (4S)-4-hydroxy-2-oxoglutarate aldolase
MNMTSWLERVEQERVIAVIRTDDWEIGWQMAVAVAAGGIKSIEIAANSDRPWESIEKLQQAFPDCRIGTGTVLTTADLENAIAANVAFMFAPHTNSSLIDRAVAAEIPIVPGALTPTEIVTAWQAGATAVKVFPIQSVGGSDYLRALQGPLGQIPLIPTGGVDLDNTIDLLNAGAIAVGMSSCLFPKQAIIDRNWQLISDRVRVLVNKLTIDN